MCGGTEKPKFRVTPEMGLSPHVRGNRHAVLHLDVAEGPIPACAGEPFAQRHAAATDGAYPRMCGGTISEQRMAPMSAGLSPHVRGNLFALLITHGVHGPIPACAGEPTSCLLGLPRIGAYPRMCGGTSRS